MILISIFITTPITYSLAQSSDSIELFSKESAPFGLTYEQAVINYWKTILSLPEDKNPMTDTAAGKCGFELQTENGSLFYLAGNAGGASFITCKIPAGSGIFIPIITVEASTAEAPGSTVDDLNKIAKDDQDGVTSLFLKLNDEVINYDVLKMHRIHTGDFKVMFPANALFGAKPGPSDVVADGYYVITHPLPRGNHTIDIKSSLACLGPECTEPTFASEIHYRLQVD